jgi:hypothetical protein
MRPIEGEAKCAMHIWLGLRPWKAVAIETALHPHSCAVAAIVSRAITHGDELATAISGNLPIFRAFVSPAESN